jgi:hypothetical protein
MATVLTENSISGINKNYASYPDASQAIRQAANQSPFLAGMLNAFYGQSDESKFEFDANAGTKAISARRITGRQRRLGYRQSYAELRQPLCARA